MEGLRKFTIPSVIFNKHTPKYRDNKLSADELFFLYGFDIRPNGEVFYTESPEIECQTCIMDKMVRFNPIINGEKFIFTIHRLQAYKKWKNKIFEEDIIVIHKDSDMMNNHIDNLKLGTRSDRMMMLPEEQRKKLASHAASANQVYDPEKVIEFFDNCGGSWKKTMEEFGMVKSTLSGILKKRGMDTTNRDMKLDILKSYVDTLTKYGQDAILISNYFILLHNLLILEKMFKDDKGVSDIQLCKNLSLKKETKSMKIAELFSKLLSDDKISKSFKDIQSIDVVKNYIDANPIVYTKLQEYIK